MLPSSLCCCLPTGDRVPYVIISGTKGMKSYEKAEDPLFVLENNIPIDTKHYLEHFLTKPLERLFEPILENVSSLFAGDHTRTIAIATPNAGGILSFAKKTLKCLSCKAPLKGTDKTVCEFCQSRRGEVYLRELNKLNDLEGSFARLWTQVRVV